MSVPKRRKTKSTRNQRRSNIFIKIPNLILCKKCNQPSLPHIACKNCGSYKNKEVINVFKKLTKKEKKQKEKEIKTKEAIKKRETKKEEAISMEGLSKK